MILLSAVTSVGAGWAGITLFILVAYVGWIDLVILVASLTGQLRLILKVASEFQE